MVTEEFCPGRPRTDLLLMDMFRKMVRIRHFEQTAYDLYTAGRLPGFMHISIGQEATAVGACSASGETATWPAHTAAMGTPWPKEYQ